MNIYVDMLSMFQDDLVHVTFEAQIVSWSKDEFYSFRAHIKNSASPAKAY